MKVVHTDVTKVDFGNKMRAWVNFTFALTDDGDGCITMRGFRLFEGQNGLFLNMPSEKAEVKNKETGETETKWFDRVWFDPKKDDSKALLEKMTEEAIKWYNAGQKAKKANKAADEADADSSQEDDIPW